VMRKLGATSLAELVRLGTKILGAGAHPTADSLALRQLARTEV
jgi:hypothetical protein